MSTPSNSSDLPGSPDLAVHSLPALNAMTREAFVAALGPVFEHASWIADAVWIERPFDSTELLHAAMLRVLRASSQSQQIEFLRGHPPLSGIAVKAGTMTADSIAEQASARLQDLSHIEEEALDRLNRGYQERHGFPFIVCVRHYTRAGIFAELASRSARSPDQELDEALRQIGFISRARLERRIAG